MLDKMLFAVRIPTGKLFENFGFWPTIGIIVLIFGAIFLWRYFWGDDD